MREMEEAVPAKPGPKTPPKHAQLSAVGELNDSELVAAQVLTEQANLRAEVAAELDMEGPQPEPEPGSGLGYARHCLQVKLRQGGHRVPPSEGGTR